MVFWPLLGLSASFYTVVHGGLPVSYPNTVNEDMGGKLVPYNMVDTNPSCYERGLCPMFEPGSRLAAFPNSEEKAQHIMHNLFRMFGNFSLDLKYGKYTYGANTGGGLTTYCGSGCTYCGSTHPDRVPLYWYSDANQAARFKQYDENSCDQSFYDEAGETAHSTCGRLLDGGSNCDLFGGDCGFGARGTAFSEEDRAWFETEGICAANSCYTDPHCDPIFANKYDYQGTGFVEGTNGAATVYSRYTKEIFYLLPSGAHFDDRLKIAEEDYDPLGKHLTLMLQYHDPNSTQKATHCYSLFNGTAHEMSVIASNDGDIADGFSLDSYSVMFTSKHQPPSSCEPYAFVCKTDQDNFFRLPEESEYFFGTEWIDWEWSDYASFGDGYLCKENHYYYSSEESKWVVNGGPDLSSDDIWYYQDTENYGSCLGCSKIAALECVEACILSDFDDCGDCANDVPQYESESGSESESDSDSREGWFAGNRGSGGSTAHDALSIVFAVMGIVSLVVLGAVFVFKKKWGVRDEGLNCFGCCVCCAASVCCVRCNEKCGDGICCPARGTGTGKDKDGGGEDGDGKGKHERVPKPSPSSSRNSEGEPPVTSGLVGKGKSKGNGKGKEKGKGKVKGNGKGKGKGNKVLKVKKPTRVESYTVDSEKTGRELNVGMKSCSECGELKGRREGKVDTSDGLWYCTDCWKHME